MCQWCQKMKVKCHFEVLAVTMKRSANGEKCKESKTLATMVMTLPQGGEKHKRMRRVVADVVSTEEIEETLGGFSVVGHQRGWTQLCRSFCGDQLHHQGVSVAW